MTKAQLLTALGTKYDEVDTEQEIGTELGYTHYRVKVYTISGDVVTPQWLTFYVKGSDAYYEGRDPVTVPEAVTTFKDELDTFITVEIGKGTYASVKIDEIDLTNETAKITVVYNESGLKEKTLLINKDGETVQGTDITTA